MPTVGLLSYAQGANRDNENLPRNCRGAFTARELIVKIVIDRTRCQGVGMCEFTAPSIFEVGDDCQAHVLREPGSEDRGAVEQAVANCPTAALAIES
jgi:ferredoxin